MATNRSKEVEAWIAKYTNPMKDVVQRIREIILGADGRIGECIKWQAPTFVYRGNLASFFPKSKQHASLMFHMGAKIPGQHRLLSGTAATGRMLQVASVDEADSAKRDVEKVVRAWCDWRDSEAGDSGRATPRAPKKGAPTRRATPKKRATPTPRAAGRKASAARRSS